MKRSYKKNGKKKKEKSVEKLHRSTIYAAKANSMYVFSFAHVASSYNIMCSKYFVFLHSLLSCHHTLYFFLIAIHFQCCCFFRVLLFICLTVCYYSKFSYSFLGFAVSTSPSFWRLVCGINSTTKTTKN